MRVVYWQSQLFLVPLRGKHVVLSIGFANCSLAKPRDAHTAPLGAGGSSRIEYLVFFVNILPRRGPKGRAHTAPLGAGKVSAYITSLPLRGKSNICPKGPLRGNEQSGPQRGPEGASLSLLVAPSGQERSGTQSRTEGERSKYAPKEHALTSFSPLGIYCAPQRGERIPLPLWGPFGHI